jgi:hypothetical protein
MANNIIVFIKIACSMKGILEGCTEKVKLTNLNGLAVTAAFTSECGRCCMEQKDFTRENDYDCCISIG